MRNRVKLKLLDPARYEIPEFQLKSQARASRNVVNNICLGHLKIGIYGDRFLEAAETRGRIPQRKFDQTSADP